MDDKNRKRENDMDRQAEATKPGASANQGGQAGQAGENAGSGWQRDQGTGKGSTGDAGMVGRESWQDRTRQGDQDDAETPNMAEQGSREQTSRS